MSSTSSLPGWLADAIDALRAGNIDGWMRIYAADAVHEFPYAPSGAPRRLEGRDAIGAYMKRLPERIQFETMSDVRVHQAGDELIVEAKGHLRRVADDAARDLDYVWFIARRDGAVTRFRDYMNPLQLQAL